MGTISAGIHGPVLGKVGPIVGSSWKGKFYIKSLPGPRTKKRGKEEKKNQQKFATVHYWLQPILDFVREGFKNYSETTEGFNAAKSYALNHAFRQDNDNNNVFDPSLMLVSYGSLPNPTQIEIEKSADNILSFTWSTERQDDTNIYDQAMLLAYDEVNKIPIMKLTGQFRSTGSDTLRLYNRTGKKNTEFHVYIAFTAHDRSRQSNSIYLGKVKMK
jgi:hypothetical protein